MYKIDKNIPLINPGNFSGKSRGLQRKYPFFEMEVGDSFFVPNKKIKQIHMYHASIKTGFSFSRRTVIENNLTGVRVWRIS